MKLSNYLVIHSNTHPVSNISNIMCSPIPVQHCIDPDDYTGRTFEEARANPVREGITPLRLEACININIIDDLVRESPEQLQLMLEFSLDNTNVNVVGCPANVTILDKRMHIYIMQFNYIITIL